MIFLSACNTKNIHNENINVATVGSLISQSGNNGTVNMNPPKSSSNLSNLNGYNNIIKSGCEKGECYDYKQPSCMEKGCEPVSNPRKEYISTSTITRSYTSNNLKYSYYGIYKGENYWKIRHFKILNRNSNSIPQVGDLVQAIHSVNIRKNYIQKKYGKWTNAPSIGIINKGKTIRVKEVREVVPHYFWIKF